MSPILRSALLGVGLSLTLASATLAQPYFFPTSFDVDGLTVGSRLGTAVASQSARVLVGAPRRKVDDEIDAGTAYSFRRVGGNWTLENEFRAPVPTANTLFGAALAIEGATAVIAAPRDDDTVMDGGAVHVFVRNVVTWGYQATVVSNDVEEDDLFGSSVSVEGNILVVGAPFEDTGGVDAGAVYTFLRQGQSWVQRQKIVNPNSGNIDNQRFGMSVSISGDRIAIGAPRAGTNNRGRVHIYVASGNQFVLEETIAPIDLREGDQYGTSVALDGDTVVAGAQFGDNGAETNIGVAYVHVLNLTDWQLQQKLVHDGPGNSFFGLSVALHGDVIAVGAYNEPDGALRGAVYSFERDGVTWNTPARIGASEIGAGQRFGFAVGVADTSVVAGAPLDDDPVSGGGAAWDFEVRDCREGGVNRNVGSASNVLFVNGGSGDSNRVLMADATGPIIATVSLPPQGGNGKYFIHANAGAPDQNTLVLLPSQLGATCFQVLLSGGAAPIGNWNGIGKEHKIGASMYLDGSPIADPPNAPSLFLNLPNGDAVNLPLGTTITLQGAIIDPGSPSPRSVSLTNAIVLVTI